MNLDAKSHVITLFLISNSFNGFGFGLFLFAFGVGSGVVVGMTQGFTICIAIGAAIIGLTVVGYTGAITQHKKKLDSYASGMVMLTAAEIVHLVVLSNSPFLRADDVGLRAYFITMVFIICTSIVSMMLAWTMSYRISHARAIPAFTEKNGQQNLQA
ncbi:uncharacterized protein LOC133525620 [Cydia pomonella]|uniref:uncharacterized protein LOC133525620 n=1 Tax=Cydia pomonella TaxID=82600 RepID=UPI002ADE7D96|nr:uncharacterized protein LOC133525620 [Cydia pomonella]